MVNMKVTEVVVTDFYYIINVIIIIFIEANMCMPMKDGDIQVNF
jgi:hypothetical protein